MWRSILGAVIGCALGLVVGSVVAATLERAGTFHLLTVIACMTPFAIVGAVVGGTGAILARIDRMSPETSDQKVAQLLQQKQKLPDKIPIPTEDEAE